MGRRKDHVVVGGGGGGGGRLNNKSGFKDDEFAGCAVRTRRRTEKIGKNSYCHHQKDGRRRSMFQLVPFFSNAASISTSGSHTGYSRKMILLPIYLGLLSQVVIFAGGVKGNGEIESCVVETPSSSSAAGGVSSSSSAASGGSNGLGYFSGSSVQNNGVGGGISGAGASGTNNGLLGGGNINNNNDHAAATPVGPHSMIRCQIRTLHPDLDMENLTSSISSSGIDGGVGAHTTSVDATSITRLKLVCNNVLFFESAVSPGQLRTLSGLQDIKIENCKLTKIPNEFLSGLRHLRKLTINTGNSEWAARSLELEPEALSGVPMLRYLSLQSNHMWNLPGGMLCKIGALTHLNVSYNLLSDIEDLGLPGRPALGSINRNSGEYDQASSGGDNIGISSLSSAGGSGLSCLSELKSLDLSFNALRSLGSRRMENLKRLTDLRIQNNWLEEIEDDALFGLDQLRLLNMSSNRLVALPTKLFQPCKLFLRELDLRNNSLAALNFLNGLEHLQVLDLSMNSLSSQWITAGAFNSQVRLVILRLSHNELTHLSPSTFHHMSTLQLLDLSGNLISNFPEKIFEPLKNLHFLDLRSNRLVTINSNTFNGLYVLSQLHLDNNKISDIQVGAMKNCTSLEDLGLASNNLQDVPQALKGLQLKTLDLGENKIRSLNNDSFQGMNELIGLRLVSNRLEEIPGFCNAKLRVLNLSGNLIRKISSGAFSSCPELRVLRLDSNSLDEIPLAPHLPNLLWLNMSSNNIRRADYRLLPKTLEWFDISYNKLESLSQSEGAGGGSPFVAAGNGKNLHHSSRLRVIDASHNRLTQLDRHEIPPHIEVLKLNRNKLRSIAEETFSKSSNLIRVELLGNQLENIPLNALRFPPIAIGKPLPEFFIGGNPLLCDCTMEWLTRVSTQLAALRQHPRIVDMDTLICRLAFSRTMTHVPLPDMKPQDFTCPYTQHCFALCNCCDFDACDCQMTCPDNNNCNCYHDVAWSSNIMQCSNSNFSEIPAKIPMDATEIYLDGLRIPTLKSHMLIGRKNLKILFLNGSHIETISNKSFNGLQSLTMLNLQMNMLTTLHGYEFEQLKNLKTLLLQNNLIRSISNTTFLPLRQLEVLMIQNNLLVNYQLFQLSLNPYLVEIGIAHNKWMCECTYLHQLYGWLNDNSRKVIDLKDLQCVWNSTNKPGPHLIDYNRTCGSSWALMGMENGFDFTALSPLPLVLVFVSLVTLLILVVALVIICRENLSLWLFTRFNGFRLCATADCEDDKSYDSYLIYSQKDEEFVAQRIADELETNDNYRICLHYRDLICETGDLKEMMIGAVENSKSVLIILSRNFLQGEWSSGEYRSAFHAVLKKSQKGGGGFGGRTSKTPAKKILIVFIEDIPKAEVSPDIRSWVRHNRIKVVKWNIHSTDYGKNRKFWNKLKFVLPDPSSHYHSNITSNTTTTSASSNEGHAGIMATLKYSTTVQGDGHLHHPISHPHHNNIQHHPHHQQIIVDESGRRFTTTTTAGGTPLISSSQTNTLNSIKYWPYGATNFVALPPKYQTSHHSSSAGSHPPSVNSPGSAQSLHYHPPLPLSNPPKSPPSSQSTDSTTTTMADDAPSLMSQLTMASFHSATNGHAPNNVSATKSPVPVPKSSYSSSPRNNILSNLVNTPIMLSTSSNNGSSSSSSSSTTSNNLLSGIGGSSGGMGGESYLSLEGEHVYSTLDPPSPQPVQQSMSLMSQNILGNGSSANNGVGATTNFLNNIHLPNGYTYQPQSILNNHHLHHQHSQQQQQPQWPSNGAGSHHPHHLTSSHHQQSAAVNGGASSRHHHHHQQHHHQPVSTFVGSSPSNGGGGGGKGFKQKEGNNPVQTYLV